MHTLKCSRQDGCIKGHNFFFFLFIQKYSFSKYKRHFIYRHLLDFSTNHVSKAVKPQKMHVVFYSKADIPRAP